MDSISRAVNKFGIGRLAVMSTLLLATAAFLFYMVDRLTKPDMALLYGDLELSDSGRIVSKLDSMGIPSDVRGGGNQIFVPTDEVGRLRMVLAEEGLPNGGTVGYEIFDRSEVLGTTSFIHDINRLRALEGELSRTIRTLGKVTAARVHLVLPRRELFNRDAQEPRASIVLKLGTAGKINSGHVMAIQHLVAAAVPGLKTNNISIVDDRGNLLARGDHEGVDATPTDLDEARFEYERRLARSLEALIGRIVGPDKVRAEVNAEMDFDRLTENSEIFDPEGQVVRSVQTVEEGEKSAEGAAAQAAGAEINLPGGEGAGTSDSSNSSTNRNEETINYEISKTLRTHIHESGGVKKISVALLVDGSYAVSKEGKETYSPRSKEELANITKLVKSSIGFSEKRGDLVEVVNMRFAPLEIPEGTVDQGIIMGLERHQLVRLGEALIVCLFGLLMLLLVVKPLLRNIVESSGASSPEVVVGQGGEVVQGGGQLLPQGASTATVPGQQPGQKGDASYPNVEQVKSTLPPEELIPEAVAQQTEKIQKNAKLTEMVKLKSIEGEVHASSLKTIGDVIQKHPQEAVNVVRGWINETNRN